MNAPPAAALVRDAEWLAHRYDPGHDAIHFRHVPRAAHQKATFLTDTYLGPDTAPAIIARDEAMRLTASPAPLHLIVHSAFCCSTLLARAFDVPGVAMALKEPVILNDITGWRLRGSARPAEVLRALDHALLLLARPFSDGEAVIIKPSNVTNGLVRAMLSLRRDARALLLHAPLATYLKSIAKKGIDGRLWVRDLLMKQVREGLIDLGFAGDDYLGLTDLQAAAVGWLAQHALFTQLAHEFGPRIRTLDSETLLARPRDTMAALARHYRLTIEPAGIDAIVAGPAFTRHSKTDAGFDGAARAAEYDAAHSAHGDEIEKVLAWAAAVAERRSIALTLAAPLLG